MDVMDVTQQIYDLTELTLPDNISGAPWVVWLCQREINKKRASMI